MDPGLGPAVRPLPTGGPGARGGGIPGLGPPPPRMFNKRPKRKRSFSEIPWTEFFSKKEEVQVGNYL